MGFFTKKKKENKQSSKETEQAKKVDEMAAESTEPTAEKDADAEQKEKPGFFASKWKSIKTGAGRLYRKGKKAFEKEPDEMSDTEFDERLQNLEAAGETGYASRYYALIEELKKSPSLTALTKQAKPEEVAEAVSENPQLEEGEKEEAREAAGGSASKETAPAAENKIDSSEKAEPEKEEASVAEAETAEAAAETKTAEPEAAEEKAEEAAAEEKTEGTEAEEKTEEAEAEEKTESKEEKENTSVADKILTMKDDALSVGKSGIGIINSYQRSKALAKLGENADISEDTRRKLNYMKGQADIETSNNGFDTATSVVNLVNKAIGQFGSSSLANMAGKISGFINMALSFGKGLMAKRLEKKSVKNGLKSLLGGTEVYKELKAKYKMHGGDMRRAIRVAADRSSVQELVNADKDKLSEDYAEEVKSGNGAADQYMGLAGGRDAASIKKAMGGTE